MPEAARIVHPGRAIFREIRARGWTSPSDWAACPSLLEVAYGDLPITEELAEQLAELFGTSAQLWINLQANYDEAVGDK